MGASHFFVGLGAGIAILTVPVLAFAPGMDLPHRFATWIDGPTSQTAQASVVSISRPASGYKPGAPTPATEAPPTIEAAVRPTQVPPQLQPAFVQPPPSGASTRTGVIHGNGTPVYVRRAAGVVSANDPQIADGAPVLVSVGSGLQIGGEVWRAVRGLSGVVGWVPSSQVVVDGEGPPVTIAPIAAASPGLAPTGERMRVANTDGVGVVLRNSPRDADRSTRGLMDGTNVSILERNASDWLRVRADNGQEGWIPARYVVPSS